MQNVFIQPDTEAPKCNTSSKGCGKQRWMSCWCASPYEGRTGLPGWRISLGDGTRLGKVYCWDTGYPEISGGQRKADLGNVWDHAVRCNLKHLQYLHERRYEINDQDLFHITKPAIFTWGWMQQQSVGQLHSYRVLHKPLKASAEDWCPHNFHWKCMLARDLLKG